LGDHCIEAKNLTNNEATITALHLGAVLDRKVQGQAEEIRERMSIDTPFVAPTPSRKWRQLADFQAGAILFNNLV
jgi:hypothetical protein